MLSDGKLTTGILKTRPTLLCIKWVWYSIIRSCVLDNDGAVFSNLSVLITAEANVEMCTVYVIPLAVFQ